MNKIIFSKPKVNSTSIIKSFSLKITILIIAVISLLYWVINYSGDFKPVGWAFVIVLLFRILFWIIQTSRKNVYHLEMDSSMITLKYHVWNRDQQVTWLTGFTEIDLFEKRDHKGFFDGIEVQFKNNGEKLKLQETIWDYMDFENIYLEFKKVKNEPILEAETDMLKQLQIMNGTYQR